MDDRSNVFRRVCGWCDAPLEPEFVHHVPAGTVIFRSEHEGTVMVTHGICPPCARKQIVQLHHSMRTHEQSPERMVELLQAHDLEATKRFGARGGSRMDGPLIRDGKLPLDEEWRDTPEQNEAMRLARDAFKRRERRRRIVLWIAVAAALAAVAAAL
jgi:hypothetical protein